jgi:LysR family transcriptional regulator, hydrogen peroxide-inducible genes activator
MEFHQLRDFVAVASTGNFSEAAIRIRVAQPSLSKAVQRLEVEVGEKLFVRSKRNTRLTPAGEVLYRRALRILNEADQAHREIAETNGLKRGAVKIGILPTISPYFLPRVLAQFAQNFPTLRVAVVEDRTADLLKLVEGGDLDLAIVSLPLPKNAFAKEILFQEELLLAVPPKHPFAIQEKIDVRELENERFILMKEGHCLADQVLTFCHKNELKLQIVLETSQIETVQALVIAGLGISLVPQMARSSGKIPLVYRSLENPKPTRTVAVVWRKGIEHTRAASVFLNDLRHTSKAFQETLKI